MSQPSADVHMDEAPPQSSVDEASLARSADAPAASDGPLSVPVKAEPVTAAGTTVEKVSSPPATLEPAQTRPTTVVGMAPPASEPATPVKPVTVADTPANGLTTPLSTLTPAASQSNGQELEERPLEETPRQQARHAQHLEQSKQEYATLEPHGLGAVTTPIDNHWMYLFFRFCAERQKMQHLRDAGVPRDQLTKDETMSKEHIGNVYRELDAGSKRMKEVIIANGDQSNEEICCEYKYLFGQSRQRAEIR